MSVQVLKSPDAPVCYLLYHFDFVCIAVHTCSSLGEGNVYRIEISGVLWAWGVNTVASVYLSTKFVKI